MTSVTSHRPALQLSEVSFAYGQRTVLDRLTLSVEPGEFFAWLGPNGSGKSTLFRLISTLLPIQSGELHVFGLSVRTQPSAVREQLGITFQSPSLDGRLTVRENLQQSAWLYGLSGAIARREIDRRLSQLSISDRASDLVQQLSGGLKRRVELAKAILHRPRVLLLDEPSTGLDPGARRQLWQLLRDLAEESQLTVIVTTHLLDEADRCDRLAILHEGRVVTEGAPAALKQQLGPPALVLTSTDGAALAAVLEREFQLSVRSDGDVLRLESDDAPEAARRLLAAGLPELVALSWAQPTLEDVFLSVVGQSFDAVTQQAAPGR